VDLKLGLAGEVDLPILEGNYWREIIGKIRGKILEKTRGNFGTTPISRSKIKMYAKLKVYR
jgi:hypothetical protein